MPDPETEFAVRAEYGEIIPRTSREAAQRTVDGIRSRGGPATLISRTVVRSDWEEVAPVGTAVAAVEHRSEMRYCHWAPEGGIDTFTATCSCGWASQPSRWQDRAGLLIHYHLAGDDAAVAKSNEAIAREAVTPMPESPVIAALAKTVSDGLDRDHRVAQGLMMAARDMFREPDFYGVGGLAADQFWRHFAPHRILADVAARRTLLDEALAWRHGLVRWDHDRVLACDSVLGKPCDCGRDTRVRAVLTALAAPYQETP